MCCVLSILALIGPRAGIIVWWLIQPLRFSLTFSTILWPILGIIFLPWTTLMVLIVFPFGVEGINWIWIGLGVLMDIVAYSGSGWGNRHRFKR